MFVPWLIYGGINIYHIRIITFGNVVLNQGNLHRLRGNPSMKAIQLHIALYTFQISSIISWYKKF